MKKFQKNVARKTEAAILRALSPIELAEENEDTVTQRQTIRGLMGTPAPLVEWGQARERTPAHN